MEEGFTIDTEIPRQFSSAEEYITIQDAAIVVETVSQTAGIGNLVISLALTVSLKAMWNLQNVFQIVSYLRIISNNPANLQLILVSIYDSITLRPIMQPMLQYGQNKFETAKEQVAQDNLEKIGIENQSLFWSLGIFAVVLILLGLLFRRSQAAEAL